MIRRRKQRHGRPVNGQEVIKRDSSRLSPLVLNNPVNQSAHWSPDAYSLHDLVARFPLPQVVRCANRLVPGEDRNLPVNVHVPMLLCAGRTARKLLAKHVGTDTREQTLTETDDSIVIPGDYDGHFLRLQSRTTKDKSVVRSLKYIAQTPVPAFVNFTPVTSFIPPNNTPSGSTNNLNISGDLSGNGSHVSSRVSKSSSKHSASPVPQKRIIHPPGSVFVVSGTTKGLAKEKRKKTREVILIRCSDENGKEVLIPSDQPGEFVEVETPPNGSTKLSMLPQELITANRYPGLVRYVYGNHPPRLTPCSLMFTLIDTFEEDSLIGCLLYPNHALMIEMPMTSSLTFQVALNRDEVMDMPLPCHAMEVVQNRREVFVRDLKLKCKFVHRVNPGATAAMGISMRGMDDDMPSATVRTRQFVNEAFFYL